MADVEKYVNEVVTRQTDLQRRMYRETLAVPHGRMQTGPDQASFLTFLVKLIAARRAIEIGVFRGFGSYAIAGAASFDFAFIDADKSNYDAYYERCLVLVRTGGLIVFDNVLWGGTVADNRYRDADTTALRKLNLKVRDDERVDASLVTIGDGFLLARKR